MITKLRTSSTQSPNWPSPVTSRLLIRGTILVFLLTMLGCVAKDNGAAIYEEARIMHNLGLYSEASDLFQALIDDYPDSPKKQAAQLYLLESQTKADIIPVSIPAPPKNRGESTEIIRHETESKLSDQIFEGKGPTTPKISASTFEDNLEARINGELPRKGEEQVEQLSQNVDHQRKEEEKAEQLSQDESSSEEDITEMPLISNVFFETDLRQALSDISVEARVQIIADDTVQGIVTLELNEVPLEKALRMILVAGGFTFKKMEDYYLVGSADQKNPTFNLLSTTEYIKPNYLKAEQIPLLLSPHFKEFVHVSKERNSLSITASPEIIARIKDDISKIDVRPRQIMLQSVVLELSSTGRKTLGLDWNWSWNTAYDRSIGADSTGTFGLGHDPFLAASGLGVAEGLGFSYVGTGQLTTGLLASLKYLVENGEGSIRATPRLVTMDGEEASINIGVEEYFSITTGPVTYPYTELEIIKYGIVLKILPYISDNDEIIVEILPAEVSDVVGKGEDNLPVISRRTVSTTVRVRDRETIIIGGLVQKNMTKQVNKVSGLGDIPILGWLFKNETEVMTDSEIMVLITPRILHDPSSQVLNNP